MLIWPYKGSDVCRSDRLSASPQVQSWCMSGWSGQGHSILPAASVQAECPLSSHGSGYPPVRHSERCSGPQPCHPVSHLGSFIKRVSRKQPWGKGDLAVTNPWLNKLFTAGLVRASLPILHWQQMFEPWDQAWSHEDCGIHFAWAMGWLLCCCESEPGHELGLLGLSESPVVKCSQQRADHKNQHDSYLP